ncbi:pyruvate carboxylase [Alicyclobacillus tolerans]|uniref:pyruvate carboxylase n=1 Tax=Alicyclobacillus tolerans TaxID=90970 RepID=UPI001F02E495|nr:pyruvate carboxylase [Alicyclobacillus tolerans]MCF8567117.1 pyruvate carboxylase [Alicyclobacillus tolerans]
MTKFTKVLVANRGEIAIRVCRACTEMGIRTVAIYSKEDRLSLHRYKADEAYLVGAGKSPVEAYLDVEGIVEVAQRAECDAIHPGYGFLSESEELAQACERAGIAFIGPRPGHLGLFGDKVRAREAALAAQIPVVPGTQGPVDLDGARDFIATSGYPVILKAVSGGGGRGMRVVRNESELVEAYARASSEAQASFGSAGVYVEKYLEAPKHIEVQILGDSHGNLVHLYERDCSIQRRHQKVVEITPALIDQQLREEVCEAAVKLMKHVNYQSAGTVEFLLTPSGEFYFIEVNPRIQVEHTVTELVTGVDLVQSQIRIAEGQPLSSPDIGITSQDSVSIRGYAIQCRVTTEDPENGFLPDTGRITTYRSAAGFGVRLDTGNGFTGARVLTFYDSLLVKISTFALTFDMAAHKMFRALQEFRIRGVKTNIPFLSNVVRHPKFLEGKCDVTFIDSHQELFQFPQRLDRGTKLLSYIADVTVNGPEGKGSVPKPAVERPKTPVVPYGLNKPKGSRDMLQELGVEGFLSHIRNSERVWLTDTTFRDAHQSLLATRVRTQDLLSIAEATSHIGANLFSMEVWGGATFDASMRFLKEDPWERLHVLREAIPNILFQMLLRGANGVGYKNYPDNAVRAFTRQAAESGIDVFRIFDSLNWMPNMLAAIDEVRTVGKIAEAAICYTGDILNPNETKYDLNYYINLAMELEKQGAHVLAIKDMAGLLKPYAAVKLIEALRSHVGIPIHLHTHDTSGNAIATLLMASEAGVDVMDVAIGSLSGNTSQPNWNSLAAALQQSPRQVPDNLQDLQKLSDYWEVVRTYYSKFEVGLKAATADVYQHQMPGGQYSNLREQAIALGIGEKFEDVKKAYVQVNELLGNIVKVTPSSKMVGDFAIFMVQNSLTPEALMERADELDFPASVVDFFMGHMGQPYGGFPEQLQKSVLKGKKPLDGRPGALLPPVDFEVERTKFARKIHVEPTREQLLSYVMYPQVTEELFKHRAEFGDLTALDTLTFFYGMRPGEEISVPIEPGKTLIIKLLSISELQPDGKRTVFFELNGQPRHVEAIDRSAPSQGAKGRKVSGSPKEVGARMPGNVIAIKVKPGDRVKKGDLLMVTEAMKMEMQVQAPIDGVVQEVCRQPGDSVDPGDLLVVFD